MTPVAYHVTSIAKLASIRKHGLHASSYWTVSMPLAQYYCETVEDEGEEPVILVVPLAQLPESNRIPDHNGIEEPIMSVVREISGLFNEAQIWSAWDSSDKDWLTSMHLIGSFVVTAPVAPERLLVMNEDWRDTQSPSLLTAIH